ncbi:MAG: Uma2 family endonuclease [Phormidesmis sp. CAN_BIN44]|nr:Uma2 family endonuclease [Phormidesmis sp. CAN_BIN44]
MDALTLNLDTVNLTDDQFYELCRRNQNFRFERTQIGELIVMPPVGGESGRREADFIIDLGIWNRQTGLGFVFSSSTVFKLPNGANRSPDAAWIQRDRWEALTPTQRRKFPPISPDFVIELRSATDHLPDLQNKMQEYLNNGVQLGWLFNPQDQQVEIYRFSYLVEVLNLPVDVSGEGILPGLVLTHILHQSQ